MVMSESSGNAAQVRVVADQVADAAITRFVAAHPEVTQAPIPAPLKWAGGIAATVFGGAFLAGCLWLVSAVGEMQVTLARVDERLNSLSDAQDSRYDDLDRRVTMLEQEAKN